MIFLIPALFVGLALGLVSGREAKCPPGDLFVNDSGSTNKFGWCIAIKKGSSEIQAYVDYCGKSLEEDRKRKKKKKRRRELTCL